eukprot:6471756-Amphidinium_carterae.1
MSVQQQTLGHEVFHKGLLRRKSTAHAGTAKVSAQHTVSRCLYAGLWRKMAMPAQACLHRMRLATSLSDI